MARHSLFTIDQSSPDVVKFQTTALQRPFSGRRLLWNLFVYLPVLVVFLPIFAGAKGFDGGGYPTFAIGFAIVWIGVWSLGRLAFVGNHVHNKRRRDMAFSIDRNGITIAGEGGATLPLQDVKLVYATCPLLKSGASTLSEPDERMYPGHAFSERLVTQAESDASWQVVVRTTSDADYCLAGGLDGENARELQIKVSSALHRDRR